MGMADSWGAMACGLVAGLVSRTLEAAARRTLGSEASRRESRVWRARPVRWRRRRSEVERTVETASGRGASAMAREAAVESADRRERRDGGRGEASIWVLLSLGAVDPLLRRSLA